MVEKFKKPVLMASNLTVLGETTNGGGGGGGEGGENGDLYAVELAELRGARLGLYNGWADGFVDQLSVDDVTSTGELYDGPNSKYIPFQTQTNVIDESPTLAGNIANTTQRLLVPASMISANGDSIQIVGGAGAASNAEVTECYIGEAAAAGDPYDFATTPTPVTWNGGNTSTGLLSSGAEITSDAITFDVDSTKNYVISFQCSGTGIVLREDTGTALVAYSKAGADASTVDATGYSTAASDLYFVKTFTVSAAIQNMTLVSEATTAEAEPSEALVSVQVVENDVVEANTDFFADVSRDNGVTWTEGVFQFRSISGTLKLYRAAAIDLSAQPSGTSMRWRFRTTTNSNTEIHSVVLCWS